MFNIYNIYVYNNFFKKINIKCQKISAKVIQQNKINTKVYKINFEPSRLVILEVCWSSTELKESIILNHYTKGNKDVKTYKNSNQ